MFCNYLPQSQQKLHISMYIHKFVIYLAWLAGLDEEAVCFLAANLAGSRGMWVPDATLNALKKPSWALTATLKYNN